MTRDALATLRIGVEPVKRGFQQIVGHGTA